MTLSNNDISFKEKSIVFIGFMGAGKTTIGQLVAKKLSREFIDIDEEIEKEYKMPVSEIFKQIGEKAFREREKNIITDLAKKKFQILSVGGGAFLQEEVRKVCLSSCIVVFLDVSWETWENRIELIIDSRPVLQGKTMDEIKELFNNRQAIYFNHHLKIKTDHFEIEEVANYIVDSLNKIWDGSLLIKKEGE